MVGILLGVGFYWPAVWFVGLFGAALHLHFLHQPWTKKTKVLGSWLAWTIKFLFVLSFYWSMYPMDWLPFDFGYAQLALIFLYWSTVSLFLGTGGFVFGVLVSWIQTFRFINHLVYLLLLAMAWLLAEIGGSFLLSVFTFGPGAELNAYFSLGYLGNLLGGHAVLIQLATWGGVYVLSLVAALIAALLWQLYGKMKPAQFLLLVLILVLVLLVTQGTSVAQNKNEDDAYTVALIHTVYPVEQLFERETFGGLKEAQEQALAAALAVDPDYVIFPEDGRFFNQEEDLELTKSFFKFQHPTSTALIVDSGRVQGEQAALLQAMLYDTETNEHVFVHKRYLVPQGEFMPYLYTTLYRLFGFDELVDSVGQVMSYEIGPNTKQTALAADVPGILFCFESASAVGVRTLVAEREVPFVAHIIAHSWFHEPRVFWHQLDTALRIQAIWNEVAIVTAGSYAPNKQYTTDGKIVLPETIARGEYWEVSLASVPK